MAIDPTKTRGYRNKNPGNIDYNERNRWQGQVGREPNNGRFAVFQSHEFGIRALAALLTTYQDRHGLRSITQIISRWAPGNENDTGAYIQHVARLMRRGANDVLDLHTYGDLRPLVEAIITHELGGQPYPAETIDAGLRLAGVVPTTMREAAHTAQGRATVQAVTAASAVGVAVQAAPVLAGLQGLDWRVGIAVVVLAGLALAAFLVMRGKRP